MVLPSAQKSVSIASVRRAATHRNCKHNDTAGQKTTLAVCAQHSLIHRFSDAFGKIALLSSGLTTLTAFEFLSSSAVFTASFLSTSMNLLSSSVMLSLLCYYRPSKIVSTKLPPSTLCKLASESSAPVRI